MTSDGPASGRRPRPGADPGGRPGERAGVRSPRQELVAILILGVLGAALVFLALRQGWAHVRTAAPAPLPASLITVSGQSLIPYAEGLAIATLASLVAVLATRGIARRAVGVLLAGLGAGLAAAALAGVSAAAAVAAAASSLSPATGSGASTTSGNAGNGGASDLPNVAGFHSRAVLTAGTWQAATVLGGLIIIAAGVLVALRAARLPVMSSRYDAPDVASPGRPGQPAAPPAAARPVATGPARPGRSDSATMWESLSRGEDPT
jgi:uncharacterized membrane protein (TIGR02234 family)